MGLISNKNVRAALFKNFRIVRKDAPRAIAEFANLQNVDILVRLLSNCQKEAKKEMMAEFSELINIGYIGCTNFGLFGLVLKNGDIDIIPKDWLTQDKRPDPNFIIASSLITISNYSLSILKLIESGLENPAKSLLRVLLEHCWLFLVLLSDKEHFRLYHQAQEPDDARRTWYKHFKPNTVHLTIVI